MDVSLDWCIDLIQQLIVIHATLMYTNAFLDVNLFTKMVYQQRLLDGLVVLGYCCFAVMFSCKMDVT